MSTFREGLDEIQEEGEYDEEGTFKVNRQSEDLKFYESKQLQCE